ncbi:potassium transporter Kup [Microbacterium sp. ASV81]|uniref:Probable potassium transport system protein Kup n=1 Tax=Microbacterium capsulatum TaxID=3041921 RepID=A0ABU0XL69_9MICO|nr:KUP/HAK/KT family potassium transporter [Microbacterium sp. ASV81]MDQ4215863.1 KUP/HAK/KT family potassium transporter [Microbacterium sp. ASV81]
MNSLAAVVSTTTGRSPLRLALIVGALGVVFGDIGTSPIYTLQTVFDPSDPHPVPLNTENLYGVVSLIVWSIILIVTITYVSLAMRMDNDGEGGIMALLTLLRRWAPKGKKRTVTFLSGLAVLGAALFLGDSMITPAISVLSAVEGLKVINPDLGEVVVPATAAILLILFLLQKFGSAVVGRLFGPVMAIWFVIVALLGIGGILHKPEILLALLPTYAIGFMVGHFQIAFFALAAVVLSVTGAEALYADMGHFGRKPITIAWLFLVFPACALSYLGQGALVLEDKGNITAPFFLLAPTWGRIAFVILATAATVIASQSVISGAFSVASQASGLGYLPRLRVLHTSTSTHGQIYVPWINWLLAVSVVTLVFAFRSSAALAFAYGMAVTGAITTTTILFFYLARRRWKTPPWVLWVGGTLLITVDLLFVAVNLTKFVHGAWLPLVIGLVAFTVMTTWERGRELITARRTTAEGSLAEFVQKLRTHPSLVDRVPGTAIFLNPGATTTPLALRANVEHNHVRHSRVIILSVIIDTVPRIKKGKRFTIDDLGDPNDGILQISARFGYAEKPDLPKALRTLPPEKTQGFLDLDKASYFLSKIELREGNVKGMARWRKRLFLAASHITTDASDHFGLPRDRVIVMGSQIEL